MTMGMPVEADIFKRIAEAQATQSGNFIRDGKYLLAIKKMILEGRFAGPTFIVELIVLQSEPIPGLLQLGGEPVPAGTPGAVEVVPNAVGEVVSFVAVLGNAKGQPNAAGNVKAFMLALTNMTEAAFNADEATARQQGLPSPFEKSCLLLVGPGQPMRGGLIRCQTGRKVNQGRTNPMNKGKILVMPQWIHHANTKDDISTRRAQIEGGHPVSAPLV